jgi:uncharacterized protein YfaP (DUF2135 family)
MIFVDDQSGKGSSLLSSGADLTITGQDKTMRIRMDPKSAGEDHRYWLAGCLFMEGTGFGFINVNSFSEVRPSTLNPLQCHNMVTLKRETEIPYSLPSNVVIKITLRDGVSNALLPGAMVQISTSAESHARMTNSNGTAAIPISHNGKYKIDANAVGYISSADEIEVSCRTASNCTPEILVSLSPMMAPGSIRAMLNWEDNPPDMDLYSLQVNMYDSSETCLTYHHNMNGCPTVSLDQNNDKGGNNGAETITYRDVEANSRYTHMIFIDDYSGRGASLAESRSRITITNGVTAVTVEMPEFGDSTAAGVRYWFAGCLQVVGDSFNFQALEQFSRERPSDQDKLFCDKLFQDSRPTERPRAPFCDDVHMVVKVHNALTNQPIKNATLDIHYIHDEYEELVASNFTTLEDGLLDVIIHANGKYAINVRADGYIHDRGVLNVTCDINDCSQCQPIKLFSLSPTLEQGSVRIVMNWDAKPTDLDIYTFQTDIEDRSQTCTTNYRNSDGCQGVTLDRDNARGGTNGAETITFHNITTNNNFVYMVYITDYSRRPEEFANSNVHLTITDGVDLTHIHMEKGNFNSERYWFAGCMRIVGNTFDFVASNAFTTNPPKDQVPEHCINLFGLNIDPIACFEDNYAYPGNDMNNGNRNKKNTAVECREDCLRTDACVGFTWNKISQDCWLKPTMVQGRRDNPETISGLAVCEDQTAPPAPTPESNSWWPFG